ncbi:hypothetical protein K3729_06790 [Rhodobacteraceae bacterium S2214]|nr:hypothetical protein K3729_06790 [Rhodobacteraceae bacterium S2214]
MPHVKQLGRRVCAAIVAATLSVSPAVSQQVQLTAGQVQQIALAALQQGDARVAAQAANALLERDPQNAGALILRTEAALLAEDFAGAVEFGSRAHWNAATANQRFSAARLVAFAHVEQENYTRSQAWLRLARQDAPNDQAREAVARDFRAVRSRNPLSVNLRFGITPSTNVNNGSSSETTDLFDLGLPFVLNGDARALSGWEASASANLRYRAHTNETSATFLDLGFSGRTYWLTENAKDQAGEGVTGSDFSNATLSLGATHRFILSPDMQPTSATLSFGQSWYGGDANARFVTASASQSWKLSDRDTILLSGFAQKQTSLEDSDPVMTYNLQTVWARDLADYGNLAVSIAVRDSQSNNRDADYDSARVGINYDFPEPLFGVQIGTTFSYEARDFEASRFSPLFGRDETIKSASVRAVFTDIEYLGFQPVVNIERTVQESSIDLFDREFTNFGFDITSSF